MVHHIESEIGPLGNPQRESGIPLGGITIFLMRGAKENTRAGLAAANKRGRRGGRPRAMNEQTIKHAEAMLKDTENYPFIGDVIDQLKIGRTAFYRYFPTDRIKQLRNEHETNLQTG